MIYKLFGNEVEIDFKENPWHSYTLIKDGKPLAKPMKLLGTTTATGVVDKSSQLIIWATRLAGDYLQNKLNEGHGISAGDIAEAIVQHRIKKEEAADTGTQIHDWIEQFVTNKKAPALPTDPLVLNGITAFLKWVDAMDVEFIESECVVYSRKSKYVGKLDAIAKVNKKLTLIDYKSSKGIYSSYNYQTALYRNAYEEERGKELTGDRIILKLGKNDGEFLAHQCDNYAEDLKAGLACVTLKKREQALAPLIKQLNTQPSLT